MDISVFDFSEYRQYLLAVLATKPKRGHGWKSQLAKAIGCEVSYISRVLKDQADLSAEQIDKLNIFLGHTDEESRFFHLLQQISRAGTESLRRFLEKQIREALEKRLVLKNRLQVKEVLSREAQAIYYSAWYYTAVHMALTIGTSQTKEEIASRLGLSIKRVSEVLEFLVSVELAQVVARGYTTGTARLHLGSDSPFISRHHVNWRMEAARALDQETNTEALHYSSVVTLNEADFTRIKSQLIKAIESAKAVIRDSPAQKICAFNMDWFELG